MYSAMTERCLESPLVLGTLRMVGVVGIEGGHQVAVTEDYVSTFFDVSLKGAPAAELMRQASYPEVEYAKF